MKGVFSVILASMILFQLPAAVAAGADDISITATEAILIDFESGEVLFEKNADNPRSPASMAKTMTFYLVYEAVARGDIGFDTVVPISDRAMEVVLDPVQSNIPLSQSGEYTVDELLDIVIVASACGAAFALAELVGGTERSFLDMMNAKAEQWGIDAHFTSVYGGAMSTVTARAMATIARNSIMEFPEILEKTSSQEALFKGREYRTTNRLLGAYEGADGYKTGTNEFSGQCFTGTAQRGDIRIVTCVMGSVNRYADTRTLLDYGFSVLEPIYEEARLIEEARLAEQARLLEEARLAEEAVLAEEARLLEEARLIAEAIAAEEARLIEQARLAEEAKQSEIAAAELREAERIAAQNARRNQIVVICVVSVLCMGLVAVGLLIRKRYASRNGGKYAPRHL